MKKSSLKSRLLHLVQSIIFQAAVVAGVIIFFLPESFEKYELKLVEKIPAIFREHQYPNAEQYAVDMDGDSIDEYISVHDYMERLSIKVASQNMKLYDQFNYKGNYHRKLIRQFFSDIDTDGNKEIWGFTLRNDSVFLNAFEPFDTTNGYGLKMRFVDELCRKYYKKDDLSVSFGVFNDLDSDGREEFIFYLRGGYSIKPRKIYVYYPFSDSLVSKPLPGLAPEPLVIIKDVLGDAHKEIFLSSYSSCNVHDSLDLRFSDQTPFLITLTNDLEFLFPPVKYHGKYSKVYSFPMKYEDNYHVGIIFTGFGTDSISNSKEIRNLQGQLVSKEILEEHISHFSFKSNDKSIAYGSSNTLIVFDTSLSEKLVKPIEISFGPYDLSRDGSFVQDVGAGYEREILGLTRDRNTVVIISNNLNNNTLFKTNDDEVITSLLPFKTSKNQTQLWAITEQNIYKLKYQANPLFYWQYAIYLAIFLGVVLFIHIIRKLNEQRLREKYKLLNQVERLKLKSLQNQLDPHFVLNTTNSIGSVILQGDSGQAYDSFVRFSRLMRVMMQTTDDIFIPLSEELNFVNEYLYFQKLRFNERISYTVELDEEIDNRIFVPKMVIMVHAENAIKHGLAPSPDGGDLFIKVEEQDTKIRLTITDNGIGRQKAKAKKTRGSGKGHQILRESFAVINKTNPGAIHQEITDLKDNQGNPAGTKIKVIISRNLKLS